MFYHHVQKATPSVPQFGFLHMSVFLNLNQVLAQVWCRPSWRDGYAGRYMVKSLAGKDLLPDMALLNLPAVRHLPRAPVTLPTGAA
jgi:hypothetical protein